jgi:hypothetical protein
MWTPTECVGCDVPDICVVVSYIWIEILMKTKTKKELSKEQGSMIPFETNIIKGCCMANFSVNMKNEETVTTHVTTTLGGRHQWKSYHRSLALWDSRADWWASCKTLMSYMRLQCVGHIAWIREKRMFTEGSLICGCQYFVTACCTFLTKMVWPPRLHWVMNRLETWNSMKWQEELYDPECGAERFNFLIILTPHL